MALTRVPAGGVVTATTFTFNSLNVTATTLTASTITGALVISGGIGAGGGAVIGGILTATQLQQTSVSVRIGGGSGVNQGSNSVAIGSSAAYINQGGDAVAIGTTAGGNGSSAYSIAIGGQSSAVAGLATYAVSIGSYAGYLNQIGAYSIALGPYAGYNSQVSGSIVISATSTNYIGTATNQGLYITPIRADASSSATTFLVYYNPVTRELTTSSVAASSVSTATNIAGGTAGQLHYQTGPGATSFVSTATTGNFLQANYTSAPTWTSTASIYVQNAVVSTNLRAGVAGQLHYQSAVDTSGFISTATTGNFLQANFNGAPTWTGTGSMYVYRATIADSATGGAGSVTNALTINNSNTGAASGSTYNGSAAVTISANTVGALSLASGGTVSGAVTFSGPVTFSGSATYILSTNTFYTDNLIELHTPPAGVYTPWFTDDGKDIGLRFHYYTASTDTNAALVLANDTKYLEWYSAGAESASGAFTGTVTYGVFKTGSIKLVTGTQNQANTSTGDLTVLGGVGIGGSLYVAGTVTATTFVGAFSGAITGASTQVQTVAQPGNATYYPTFVSANNASATGMSVYTTSSFAINPSTGNVGVGTTSPTNKFVVSNAGGAGLEIAPTGGTASGPAIISYNRSGSAYTPITRYGLNHVWFTGSAGSTRALDIDSGGNVGINTSAPTAPLYVVGTGTILQPSVYGTSYVAGLKFRNEGYAHFTVGGRGSSFVIANTSDNGATVWGTAPIDLVTVASGGSVSIGTTSTYSGEKLAVNGGAYVNGTLTATTFVGAFSGTVTGAATQLNTQIATASANYYPTFVDSNNATSTAEIHYTTSSFVINPATGAVGINTSTAQATLHVQSGGVQGVPRGSTNTKFFFTMAGTSIGSNYFEFQSPATADSSILFSQTGGAGSQYGIIRYDNTIGAMSFWTTATQQVTILQSGGVGIGTTSLYTAGNTTTGTLSVAGAIIAGDNQSTNGTVLIANRYGSGLLTVFGSEYSSGGAVMAYGMRPNTAAVAAFNNTYGGGGSLTRSAITQDGNIKFYTTTGATLNIGDPVTISERMRITTNGGIAFGGSTNYGTSGQVLKSNGDAAPTWVDQSTLTTPTSAALTMNNAGSGAASGTTFNGSTAVTISYNTIGAPLASQLTNGAAGGSSYNSIVSLDSRSTLYSPGDRSSGFFADFKQNTTDGLADGGTYHGVLTFRPYGTTNSDFSGGQAQQIGTTDNNNLWHRISASSSTWGTWYKIIDTNNATSTNIQFNSVGVGVAATASAGQLKADNVMLTGTAPISLQGNSNSGTYNQTVIYANQNNTSANNANGIFIERGRLTDSAAAEIRYLTIGSRGGQVQFTFDGSGNFNATAEITAYSSDRRLKTNARPIDNAVEKVSKLNGIIYNWNELANQLVGYSTATDVVGLFAQDVEQVLPEAVKAAPFDLDENGNSKSGENYKTIQYEKLVPLLVEAIKEQQQKISEQTEIIKTQQDNIDKLLKHLGLN